jgi:hypothetical protein
MTDFGPTQNRRGSHDHCEEALVSLHEQLQVERALCDRVMDVLSRMVVGWEHIIGADLAQHPDVIAVAAEWRAARGR